MNWQTLSILGFFLFGIASILGPKSAQAHGGTMTFLFYSTALFVTGIVGSVTKLKIDDFSRLTPSIGFASIAGAAAGIAVIAQMHAIFKFPEQTLWIIVISSLYPVITVLFFIISGVRPSLPQTLGILCGIACIVLINWPTKH
jgi:drug/metabolite transporter (DMT)-like permease